MEPDIKELRILGAVIEDGEPTRAPNSPRMKAKKAVVSVQWEDGAWSTMTVEGEGGQMTAYATLHISRNNLADELTRPAYMLPPGNDIAVDLEIRGVSRLIENPPAADRHECSSCGKLNEDEDTAWTWRDVDGVAARQPICGGGCK